MSMSACDRADRAELLGRPHAVDADTTGPTDSSSRIADPV